jgi:hypothetical protein
MTEIIQQWIVTFYENGEEFTGTMVVTAKKIDRIGNYGFCADGVIIKIDEPIISIEPKYSRFDEKAIGENGVPGVWK